MAVLIAAAVAGFVAIDPPRARQVPSGLSLEVVGSGLTAPTAFRFASDGRIFVAEKSGRVVVLDGFGDTSPTLFADLSTNVYDIWDLGLLGLALHPDFPRKPFIYVAYTHNAPIGGTAPKWPSSGGVDSCPDPPGILKDGCVTSGRLSVLTARGDRSTGPERVLIEDWCQQSNTHSVGDIHFGRDGALYMSGGEGRSTSLRTTGSEATPRTPAAILRVTLDPGSSRCTAEGGALRAQDLFAGGDPVSLGGTVIRVDARTGRGLPDNPRAESNDENARRIVAYGLKQPYRFTIRPGTSEVWVGDVGESQWEEIDVVDTADATVENFGWPCYEGNEVQDEYKAELQIATFDLCQRLYAEAPGTVTAPRFTYAHGRALVPGDRCPTAGASISGIAFGVDGPYSGALGRALFLADASRGCIWALPLLADGLPDTEHPRIVARHAGIPVDLQVGADGFLYYLDFERGTIVRIGAEGLS